MKIKYFFGVGFLTLAIAVTGTSVASASVTITKVYDGDTITLSSGEKVRFLQIDTPELSPAECYGQEARRALVNLLNTPGQLSLQNDPKLDQVDRYGRLLRYIFIGKTNINLKMVEIGAAAPYFYKGDKGKYATQILQAAKNAKAKSIGLWKSCPGTQLTPNNAVTAISGTSSITPTSTAGGASAIKCDPNYAGCIPVYPPDLNCSDIKRLGLAPVKVIGEDVHKLDRDGNGVGCDS